MTDLSTVLNTNLAAAMDLHARCKHAHWNCVGAAFIGVHKLFDDLAENAEDYADSLAEHIRFLGQEANGTTRAAAKSFLGPYTIGVASVSTHLSAVLADLNKFNASITGALAGTDQITADVLISIGRGLAKDIYLTKSHLGATNG